MPFVILDFQAGEPTMRERLTRRRQAGSDASDADVPVLEQQLAGYDPIEADERPQVITVDSENPAAAEMLLTAVAERAGRDGARQ